MSLTKLDKALDQEVENLKEQGTAKPPERVIEGYIPPRETRGPRYRLQGIDRPFIRMNSNAYLSLSTHPELIKAADQATGEFGVGPGAVRFIDGTFIHHTTLEEKIARFVDKPAAKIFNSAYTANCGLALAIGSSNTHWIGDQLNHNSIIRAMRISNVKSHRKGIFRHNDMDDLQRCLDEADESCDRAVVVFDGIFSMRGDYAPIDKIEKITEQYQSKFKQGVITVVDDSHGIGAYGSTGRGTPQFCGASPDIIVGTFGKAFSVNGGFIAASRSVIEAVRQKADTYIYTNPLSVADCAAAARALDICDTPEGTALLNNLKARTEQFRRGLEQLGKETIPGPHPVVPLVVRDSGKTHALVKHLFEKGILVVGLTFPVVPRGDETIRFQINAAHTAEDITYVLEQINQFD
ncbi:MAG TPA: aminotransferase class I/II-fold pyridoxal phosphate-dependent enzyme [Desulfobacteraceae bacterium]|nr:aminotransferase class I/II-fold pyridoxal phosphate-dependent enzyme [Desulfobacteraceae bacterium]